MAMTRRRWSALMLAGVGSCVASGPPARTRSGARSIEAQPRRHEDAVAVFLPDTSDTQELWYGLRTELEGHFDVIPLVVTGTTTPRDLGSFIVGAQPRCVVLVNNATVRLYQAYVADLRVGASLPPVVVVMASFLRDLVSEVPHATGIAYEVPLVSSIIQLRSLLVPSIARVGVVRRRALARYVGDERRLAALEAIEVVDVEVPDTPTPAQLRRAIRSLRRKHDVDALWVLNDNALLTPSLVVQGWVSELELGRVPVIVGVDSLVHPELHFGSFAVLPDHEALGVQTAELVYELETQRWQPADVPIQRPLSVESVVDGTMAARLGLRPDARWAIDRVVE